MADATAAGGTGQCQGAQASGIDQIIASLPKPLQAFAQALMQKITGGGGDPSSCQAAGATQGATSQDSGGQ